ncbi:MAG: hypothetical protein OHK0032_07980 [Thermodesulfovibrionales bacterium]
MKGFFKKLETLFVAVTFAEHGEVDEARRIMKSEEGLKVEEQAREQMGGSSEVQKASALVH